MHNRRCKICTSVNTLLEYTFSFILTINNLGRAQFISSSIFASAGHDFRCGGNRKLRRLTDGASFVHCSKTKQVIEKCFISLCRNATYPLNGQTTYSR